MPNNVFSASSDARTGPTGEQPYRPIAMPSMPPSSVDDRSPRATDAADLLALARRVIANRGPDPSRLTPNGWPIEETIASDGIARIVFDPGTDVAERWRIAEEHFGLRPDALGEWSDLARESEQGPGLYLGLRSRGGNVCVKLYQRVVRPEAVPMPSAVLLPAWVGMEVGQAPEIYGLLTGARGEGLAGILDATGTRWAEAGLREALRRFMGGRDIEQTILMAGVQQQGRELLNPTIYVPARVGLDGDAQGLAAARNVANFLECDLARPLLEPSPTGPSQRRLMMFGLRVSEAAILPCLGLAMPFQAAASL